MSDNDKMMSKKTPYGTSQQSHHAWIWTIPSTGAALTLSSFCALCLAGQWPGEDVGASDVFCEANHHGWMVKQPVNTFSSLVFVLVGLVIARYSHDRCLYKDWRVSNLLTRSAHLQTLHACVLVSIGLGSMFYHASGTAWSGTWDVVAQLPYAAFLCVYSLVRLLQSHGKLKQESKTFWCMYIMTTLVVGMPRLLVDIEYAGPIAGLVVAFLLFEVVRYCRNNGKPRQESYRHLISALICIVLGYAVLLLSTTGAAFCRPQSLLQGHALWHVLSAASTVFVFLFFVTEGDNVVVVKEDDTETLVG